MFNPFLLLPDCDLKKNILKTVPVTNLRLWLGKIYTSLIIPPYNGQHLITIQNRLQRHIAAPAAIGIISFAFITAALLSFLNRTAIMKEILLTTFTIGSLIIPAQHSLPRYKVPVELKWKRKKVAVPKPEIIKLK